MISVLVVDDEPSLGKAIQRDLIAHGFDTHVALGSEAALAVLRRLSIDVLLTDLKMTGGDGIDLLRRARQLSARTRTILMSGHATARDYQNAIELGAVRVLCKPFGPDELVAAVRQAAECEEGFRGNFHGLSIFDVIQMLHLSRRGIALIIHSPRPGRIFLREGEVIHAECGDEVGEAAVRSILELAGGTFTTDVLPADTPVTVRRPFEPVLLDAVRAIDERRKGVPVAVPKNGHHLEAGLAFGTGEVFAAPRQPEPSVDVFERWRRASTSTPALAPLEVSIFGSEPPSAAHSSSPVPVSAASYRKPPNPASESFERGLELLRRRELSRALDEWQRAVELEPDNRTYRANLRRLERLVAEGEPK